MRRDFKFIIFFILAFIFFLLYLLEKNIKKTNEENRKKAKGTKGKITMINMSDLGNVWYKVLFNSEGKEFIAQSQYYRLAPDNIRIGDNVNIKYYFTKSGVARCMIVDQGFESVSYGKNKWDMAMIIISSVFLGFGCYGFIKFLL